MIRRVLDLVGRMPPGTIVGGALVVAYLAGFAWAMEYTSYDIWPALFIVPVLAVFTLPMMIRSARRDGDAVLLRFAPTIFILKMLGAVARYAVVFGYYGGAADASGYNGAGREMALLWRSGHFEVTVRKFVGTGFIEILTAAVYTVTGATKLGGFFVFSWFCFIGMYLIYRAVRMAVPEVSPKRYLLLLFMMPSMLFWPSSLGKESWMLLTIGIMVNGVARLLTRNRFGFVLLALGGVGSAVVRPHITLLVYVCLFMAFVLRRSPKNTPTAPLFKGVGIVLLLIGGFAVVSQVETFFGVDTLDTEGIDQVLANTEAQTTKSDSSYDTARPTNPVQVPVAIFTVLYRPLITEANNPLALATAAEGTFLLFLTWRSRRRLRGIWRWSIKRPFVAFSTAYVLIFGFAFSSIGNFGLLARQRSQVLPFLLLLLCLPKRGSEEDLALDDDDEDDEPAPVEMAPWGRMSTLVRN